VNKEMVEIVVNGRAATTERGTTVAAALLNAGQSSFRTSVTGDVRGPVCGMGVCFECRVTIDDAPHQRACLTLVSPGMRILTSRPPA
jgi:sarcosine oxidase subunit alpha